MSGYLGAIYNRLTNPISVDRTTADRGTYQEERAVFTQSKSTPNHSPRWDEETRRSADNWSGVCEVAQSFFEKYEQETGAQFKVECKEGDFNTADITINGDRMRYVDDAVANVRIKRDPGQYERTQSDLVLRSVSNNRFSVSYSSEKDLICYDWHL